MKKYHIKIKDKVVHRTDDKKKALQVITKIFRDGHGEVSLQGAIINMAQDFIGKNNLKKFNLKRKRAVFENIHLKTSKTLNSSTIFSKKKG